MCRIGLKNKLQMEAHFHSSAVVFEVVHLRNFATKASI
jgi:hypothetical protein